MSFLVQDRCIKGLWAKLYFPSEYCDETYLPWHARASWSPSSQLPATPFQVISNLVSLKYPNPQGILNLYINLSCVLFRQEKFTDLRSTLLLILFWRQTNRRDKTNSCLQVLEQDIHAEPPLKPSSEILSPEGTTRDQHNSVVLPPLLERFL